MGASKASRGIAASVPLSFDQGLTSESFFEQFFCFDIIFVFAVFDIEKGLLLLRDAAGMRICKKAIVSGVLALGPFIDLMRFLIEAFLIKQMMAIEAWGVSIFSNLS